MSLIKKFSNEKGSAQIVAVLSAAAISAVIMLSNAEMLNQSNKQNKQIVQTNVALDVKRQIEALLSEPDACTANFGTLISQTTMSTQDIEHADGGMAFDVGNTMEAGNLQFAGWTLVNTGTVIRIDPGPPQYTHVIADLTIHLTKTDVGGSVSSVPRVIKLLTIRLGGVNDPIERCFAMSADSNDLWEKDVTGNHITNKNIGNVGFNTNNPSEKLDVVGDVVVELTARVRNIVSSANSMITQNLSIGENTGIGQAPTGERLSVTGNTLISGDLTIGGSIETESMSTTGDYTMTGGSQLTSTGTSTLNSVTVSGAATFAGPSNFSSSTIFSSPVSASSSVAVGATTPGALSPDFGVGGSGYVAGIINVGADYNANQFCIGGNCRTTFAEQSCPGGSIRQTLPNGTVTCSTLSCGADRLFKGLDGAGNPICADLPLNSCPSGQFLEQINPATGAITCRAINPNVDVTSCAGRNRIIRIVNGVAQCASADILGGAACPAGTVAIGYNADGVASCASPIRGAPLVCAVGEVVKGINANGTPICGPTFSTPPCPAFQVATGMNPDGTLKCSPVSQLIGGSCSGPDAVAVGFNTNGTPICGCAPRMFSWTVGGKSCQAGIATRYANTTDTAVDSNFGNTTDVTYLNTGSASFNCDADGNWNPTPLPGATCSAPFDTADAGCTAVSYDGTGVYTSGSCSPVGGTCSLNREIIFEVKNAVGSTVAWSGACTGAGLTCTATGATTATAIATVTHTASGAARNYTVVGNNDTAQAASAGACPTPTPSPVCANTQFDLCEDNGSGSCLAFVGIYGPLCDASTPNASTPECSVSYTANYNCAGTPGCRIVYRACD